MNARESGNAPLPPILIIGGGLSGLALGQGLKRLSIAFRIIERDDSASLRAQGYRIRIGTDGATALQKLLPPHLYEAFEATCAEVVQGIHVVDAMTGKSMESKAPGHVQKIHGDRAFNADRAVLRNVLLTGLEVCVEFGKRFERYELKGEDTVVAHFTDGNTIEGSLLVGADGVRSAVRRQLLPGLKLLDTEGRAVFGKTIITEVLMKRIPSDIGNGLTVGSLQDENRMKLFTDGMRFGREEATKHGNQLNIEIPADYIYWVLVFRKDVLPDSDEALLSLTQAGSRLKSLDLTSNWHESLRALIRTQLPNAASTLAFLTTLPTFVDAWDDKPPKAAGLVTLMGDSAHPIPPVGGLGANTAFQDAADLLQVLRSTNDSRNGMEEINLYESKMLDRARLVIGMSTGGAGRFFGMKPLDELREVKVWH